MLIISDSVVILVYRTVLFLSAPRFSPSASHAWTIGQNLATSNPRRHQQSSSSSPSSFFPIVNNRRELPRITAYGALLAHQQQQQQHQHQGQRSKQRQQHQDQQQQLHTIASGAKRMPMLSHFQMNFRAFLVLASKVWTCVCYMFNRQVRAVSIYMYSRFL